MSLVTINVGSHGQPYTVSEMRRRLAQVLAKLDGKQEVSFSFVGVLESYRSTDTPTVHQIEAEENSGGPYKSFADHVEAARVVAKSQALGAPYKLDENEHLRVRGGVWKSPTD